MDSEVLIWGAITIGFVGAMLWAWRICQPTKDERTDMLRHLQRMDAARGRK